MGERLSGQIDFVLCAEPLRGQVCLLASSRCVCVCWGEVGVSPQFFHEQCPGTRRLPPLMGNSRTLNSRGEASVLGALPRPYFCFLSASIPKTHSTSCLPKALDNLWV